MGHGVDPEMRKSPASRRKMAKSPRLYNRGDMICDKLGMVDRGALGGICADMARLPSANRIRRASGAGSSERFQTLHGCGDHGHITVHGLHEPV